ncbi:hypothetical protein [Vibrio sinaloensis]|uniref:hypothetical protein n=1 Tax=Photobacterium sp. (strain ATCC 43367) TaxID=379097 RepID=UPI0035E81461
MKDSNKKLIAVKNRLSVIPTSSAVQVDEVTNSVGISFSYLGRLYTTYFDADTERGELLLHELNDISVIQNIGSIDIDSLVAFFGSLPDINQIAK